MKVYGSERWIQKGSSVGIFHSKCRTRNETPHSHEFIEIVYVSSGSATQRVDKAEYEVERGDILFINYGSVHAFLPHENFSYINICFSPETLGNAIITEENALALLSLTTFDEMRRNAKGDCISFRGAERREVEQILDLMLREYRECLPASQRMLESYLNILITKMLRKTASLPQIEGEQGLWRELAEYIEDNPDAELTLAALARKCFYNPSYFSRAFKKKFHMPLTEYVARRRVEHAISLLRESTLSVEEICTKVGFPDRSSLYHAFAKFTGASPSAYRNEVKKFDK